MADFTIAVLAAVRDVATSGALRWSRRDRPLGVKVHLRRARLFRPQD